MDYVSCVIAFSSPEPFVSLSRRGLVHKQQVTLGTHDLIGYKITKGVQSDQPFQAPCLAVMGAFITAILIGFPLLGKRGKWLWDENDIMDHGSKLY